MQLSYRGSVNAWECDENAHLNVRFYVEKHWQTLVGGLEHLPLAESVQRDQLSSRVHLQHIRFLAESRLAQALSGYVGVVAVGVDHVDVLTELRHSFTDKPSSTCIHRLRVNGAQVSESLPDYAQPRGLADEDLKYAALSLSDLPAYGFQTIGLGSVLEHECDHEGRLQLHHYMGRLSDSMPHLWGLLRPHEGNEDETEGGAVLEYRLRYHEPLRRHQSFQLSSGVAEVAPKIQKFAHLMFNSNSGLLCASAQAVAVRMDLLARKAITLSDVELSQMRPHTLRPIQD